MTFSQLLRKPSALLPVLMSTAAVATLLVYVAFFGTEPQPDEGTAARIWQLLMLSQVPISAVFALRWIGEEPKNALYVLLLQVGAVLMALAPVLLLGF